MSTKTLRKRIALVAVSAMGFGLISGVSPANAGESDLTLTSGASIGLISSSITDDLSATAVLMRTGTLGLTVAPAAAGKTSKVVVSSGGYISKGGAQETVSADQLTATGTDAAASGNTLEIKATGAVGTTFTITSFVSADSGAAANNIITVTIADSATNGTVVAANSTVSWANGAVAQNADSATANETTTGISLYLSVKLKDAYKALVTSTSGAFVATASAGANVSVAASAPAAGTFSTAVSNASPENLLVRVSEATAGAGWSGTVSITYNGVAIATKTGKISGNIASLSATAAKVVKNDGSARSGAFRFEAKDAAGNIVPLSTVALTSSSVANAITSASSGTASTADTKGYGTLTAGSGATGSTNIVVQTTLASGTVVKSAPFSVLVGGAAYTYSAAFDKAKYAQGDIAILTISFKDSKGNAANSGDSVTALAATQAAIDATISSPMLEKIGNVPGVSDLPNEKGQIVYKFNVGGSGITFAAGKYNAIVTYPYLSNGEAQTVGYEVSGSGGVSNSDILASIVKLITAINKQIAALQKLLLKR